MKVIDLLNRIANGEEVPKKVKYKTFYWEYREEEKDYKDNEGNYVFACSNYDIPGMLNNEIEIIEEKKILEKLKWNEKSQHNVVTDNTKKTLEHLLSRSEQLKKSINEIIDYLKKQRRI